MAPMITFIRENAPWLAVGGLLTFGSSFGQTFFIALFAADIQGAFGLSHGDWGGIYTIATLGSAAVMIWAGKATDVFRVRAMVPVVWGVLAGACIWMGVAGQAWMLLPIMFLLRFAGQGMSTHIAVVAMSRWFVASRGKALSVARIGYSVGEAVLPLLIVWALVVFQWQTVWLIVAASVIVLTPLVVGLLGQERTPQTLAKESASVGMAGRHWTRNQVARHWLFWMMLPALIGPPCFITAFFFHQVHYTGVVGLEHIQFVQFFPVYTGVAVISVLWFGAALDRYGTARLLPIHQIPLALAFFAFAFADGPLGIGVGFVLLGMTAGATNTLPNAFWAEYFGTQHLGAIKSMAMAIMVFGSALGPGLTGILLDWGIEISAQLWAMGLFFALTTVAMVVGFARAPRLPSAL